MIFRLNQMQTSGMVVVVVDTMDMRRGAMKITVMPLLDRIPICMAVILAMQITNHPSNRSK